MKQIKQKIILSLEGKSIYQKYHFCYKQCYNSSLENTLYKQVYLELLSELTPLFEQETLGLVSKAVDLAKTYTEKQKEIEYGKYLLPEPIESNVSNRDGKLHQFKIEKVTGNILGKDEITSIYFYGKDGRDVYFTHALHRFSHKRIMEIINMFE